MGHSFLEIETYKKKSILSRITVTGTIVLTMIVGILFFAYGEDLLGVGATRTQGNVALGDRIEQYEGGDIFIDRPEPEPPAVPELIGELPDPSKFTAQAIIVKDVESGMILYEKFPYAIRPIASITKLMSSLVLLERGFDLETTTEVTQKDIIDTHMYAGDTYTLDELWHAALIASSNKAIMTLAEAVGWNDEAFVDRMNQKALELGMGDTRFTDPTGLDASNISTASDISVLLDEVLRHDEIVNALLTPEYTLYSSERGVSHHMWNTNWLLLGWIPNELNIVGGKTGYIPDSGYNFTMQVEVEGRTLNVVVLGANVHEARFTEARDVVKEISKAYSWPRTQQEEEL